MNISLEEEFLINILFEENIRENILGKIEEINYEKLIKISSSHLVIPALFLNLKKKNIIDKFPNDFTDYLREIYVLNKKRNLILLEEINYLKKKFNEIGVKFIFLKGSWFILNNMYYDIGERMINDIDILVLEESFIKSIKYLKELGYNNVVKHNFFNHRHFPRLTNKNKLFAVEIHSKLFNERNDLLDEKKILKNLNKNNNQTHNEEFHLYHNIYNYQINDSGNINLNYSYRNFYDTYILLKQKKIDLKSKKYINNYLMIASFLKIKLIEKNRLKFDYLSCIRFKLKYKFKCYYKIERFTIFLFSRIIILPKQICEFVKNINYRRYIYDKYLKSTVL